MLSLYRDHAAEDAGLAEDIVDLAQIVSVDETDSGRSYGFQLVAIDGKRHSLAALTSGIRLQWIQALRNACNQGKMVAHLPTNLASASAASVLKAVKKNVRQGSHKEKRTTSRWIRTKAPAPKMKRMKNWKTMTTTKRASNRIHPERNYPFSHLCVNQCPVSETPKKTTNDDCVMESPSFDPLGKRKQQAEKLL